MAAKLGYDAATLDALPDAAVESFAGVANPFSLQLLVRGDRVVDVGSGAGFDSFIAAVQAASKEKVIVGVVMTEEILDQSGFVDIQIGAPCDIFGNARGEEKVRKYSVYGYPFLVRKPA